MIVRSIVLVSLVLASLVGCTAATGSSAVATEELRGPRICPAIAIRCADGYEARQAGNCHWTCVPSHGPECAGDADCTIYCFAAPCPVGVCQGGRCGVADAPGAACAATLCLAGTTCVEHNGNARCVTNDRCGDGMAWNNATGTCECTAMARCMAGWSWDPVACDCISPCAAVRCAAGTECIAHDDGSATCEPRAGI